MVKIQKAPKSGSKLGKICSLGILIGAVVVFLINVDRTADTSLNNMLRGESAAPADPVLSSSSNAVDETIDLTIQAEESEKPFYTSIDDLTLEERRPRKGERHMIDPPLGGKLVLVHCDTTAGPWSILVHHKWAPLGAARFMDMVTSGYFDNQVPLMRAVKNFLIQFGLAGSASKQFGKTIKDDPNWLPGGKEHRENEDGVRRFALGYMSYAGAGENSRTQQLFVTNKPSKSLAGGSPWEVPWGELVGKHSFETLANVYTGYGENGPGQGKLHKPGHVEWVKEEFPKLDWVTGCRVLDETEDEE